MQYSRPLEQGHIAHETIADPGAGNTIDYLLPNNRFYNLVSINFTFATNAVAANRHLHIDLYDAATLITSVWHPTVIAASNTTTHRATTMLSIFPTVVNNLFMWPLSPVMIVPGNYTFRVDAALMDAGDTFTNIEVMTRSWVNKTV